MRQADVSVEEMRAILSRYNASHFRNRDVGEHARYSIPANPERDDDFAVNKFIAQYEALVKERDEARALVQELADANGRLTAQLILYFAQHGKLEGYSADVEARVASYRVVEKDLAERRVVRISRPYDGRCHVSARHNGEAIEASETTLIAAVDALKAQPR
jgi:hypothetical protein